ncbi:unnamed protein product [Kuraishia capsulata CBS 1993]|uniref:peptidyl-tRNA hydrolase n=1 Tax=Kuraishia capsulata CBS 1993 TaxID=1382522 RepID=W6MR77_9ASCO|nr:uncharacterized protein KUCA_T00005212001 [Kuraishia capsulata CBS 1993]CDK29224.1 unnamed protein product [Kuraishia capsulata CBS 1993]
MSGNLRVSQLVLVSAISLLTGGCIGALLALPSSPAKGAQSPRYKSASLTPTTSESLTDAEEEEEDDYDDEGIEIDSTPLNEVPGECQMSLVVRKDLEMTKGKAAAQCAHAAVALYKLISSGHASQNLPLLMRWEKTGQAKVALKCADQAEMDLLFAKAMSLNINAYVVHDAGRTQVPSGSATVLGLGPAPKAVLNEVTGDLKLY